jgi:hypothetical protein
VDKRTLDDIARCARGDRSGVSSRPSLVAALASSWLLVAVVLMSCDPTEDAFAISVLNDTSRPVLVEKCESPGCHSVYERNELSPTKSHLTNIGRGGGTIWFRFSDGAGNTLGCTAAKYASKVPNVVLRVSAATHCPDQ